MSAGRISLGVVAGLRRETALLGRALPPDAAACAVAGRPDRARAAILEWSRQRGIDRLVSFGVAGGLAPGLGAGALVVARSVVGADGAEIIADEALSDAIAARLPQAARGALMGVDRPVCEPGEKAALYRQHGALACDMESHGVARAARELGRPFACLRAIADPASRAVPAAALAGLGPDGEIRTLAVLRAALARPAEIAGLAALAFDMRRAMRALESALAAGALRV